jgi:MFS family permease
MDPDKTVIAGSQHVESTTEKNIHDLAASGFEQKEQNIIKARNAEYAAAIGENRPNPWGRGYLSLYAFCFIIYLNSTMNGYDGSLMGSINSVAEYQHYYHLPLNGASSTGIIFAIFQIGQMAGAWFVWIADWKGRRLPIFLGCVGVLVGTIVTATAKTRGVFVGGRFLLSFFCTWATTSGPMLAIELAPPQYRATVSGLYNTLWYMGSIIANLAVFGCIETQPSGSNLTWRLPLWLQMLCPGIVCLGIWFVPESPSMCYFERSRRMLRLWQ